MNSSEIKILMRCLLFAVVFTGIGCQSAPPDPKLEMQVKVDALRQSLEQYVDENLPSGVQRGGSPGASNTQVTVSHEIVPRDDLVVPYVCNVSIVFKAHTGSDMAGYGEATVGAKSDWDGKAWSKFVVVDGGALPRDTSGKLGRFMNDIHAKQKELVTKM